MSSPGSAGSASPVNSYCTSQSCERLYDLMRTDTTAVDGAVAVVTIDSREENPTIDAWRAYCAAHGYEYVHMISTATPEDVASVQDINMLFDWRTNQKLLQLLADPRYAHVSSSLVRQRCSVAARGDAGEALSSSDDLSDLVPEAIEADVRRAYGRRV